MYGVDRRQDGRGPNKAERRAQAELDQMLVELDHMRALLEARIAARHFENIPTEWLSIETDHPAQRPRTRVTIRLDSDVVKFFKLAGTGYQAKINTVLRTYMLARLAKHVRSDTDTGSDGALI